MTTDQFRVAKSELDINLEIGQTGVIMVPVEVIAMDKEDYVFRKHARVTAEGDFKAESVKDMRKKIGVVEELEAPLNKIED
jgi:hypothetical protein